MNYILRLLHFLILKNEIAIKFGSQDGEAFLFSTDISQDALQNYEFYVARFQIEFIFRDAKNFTGLTGCQSRDAKKMDYHFNASLLALNVVKIQDIEAQKKTS